MGLDISVHTHVKPGHLVPNDSDDPSDYDYIMAHVYDGFELSAAGLELNTYYQSVGEEWSFRVGSYMGYGLFRDRLARLAGYDATTAHLRPDEHRDRPFYRLVNFADNEGTIGPDACALLAEEFDAYRAQVDDEWNDRPDFQATYEQFQQAFHAAAGTGLLDFH